jgi:lipopolysaccharide/colanic/teichoic acid biosynthesis glycosyltransferase
MLSQARTEKTALPVRPSNIGDSLRVTQKDGVRADLAKSLRPVPVWKRTLDVVGAISILVLLSPAFGLTALSIKLVSRGPVFFTQPRHGAAGRIFWILKFRTMRLDVDTAHHQQHVANLASSNGHLKKLENRNDYIPCGRFWRAIAWDEVPQLINVLRGEMSLVGPRPDVLSLEDYQPWQLRRFDVVPGMTGLWQVNGKNRTTFDEMIRLDIDYVQQRSFWLDVKILLKTIPTVLRLALD